MNLDAFLYNLHFDVEKVRQVDHVVDWNDAPLSYKLYRTVPAVPLSDENWIGKLLRDTYGITQLAQSTSPFGHAENGAEAATKVVFSPLLRRYVPSGGALYPSEVYVYLKAEGPWDPGIYHYDVAHHRLMLLRAGTFDSYLQAALNIGEALDDALAVVFVSTFYWKNYFKYRDFAYRLQAIDAGVVVGQLQMASAQLNFTSEVNVQFLDDAVNHLLGLRTHEETVYAAIPLWPADGLPVTLSGHSAVVDARDLVNKLPAIRHDYSLSSKNMERCDLFVQLNDAARIQTTAGLSNEMKGLDATQPVLNQSSAPEAVQHQPLVSLPTLPALAYDFHEACRTRSSPGMDFRFHPMSLHQLSTLLQAVVSAADQTASVMKQAGVAQHLSLALCVHGTPGLTDGAYVYDANDHALRLMRAGDHRLYLQSGMSMHNVQLTQVPLCLHIVGRRQHGKDHLGYRGYRIQQMEVGKWLQRLLLVTSALGMGGHPLLDYDEALCDETYQFEGTDRTCLIQVPIGFYQSQFRFELPV